MGTEDRLLGFERNPTFCKLALSSFLFWVLQTTKENVHLGDQRDRSAVRAFALHRADLVYFLNLIWSLKHSQVLTPMPKINQSINE